MGCRRTFTGSFLKVRKMIRGLAALSWRFPKIRIRSSSLKSLSALSVEADQERYACMALVLSIVLALAISIALLAAGSSIAAAGGLLCFAISFGFLLFLPQFELRKKITEMEIEMPFFLRTMGMLLELGLPFQRALEIASREPGTLSREIANLLSQVKGGMNMQAALSSFAMAFNSMAMKRAVSQLLSAYEVGSSGAEIKKIGNDMLAIQQHRMREYASKSAMFGLLFIVTSAVFPTFFLVYAILGKAALGTEISEMQISLALLILFPLTSALILLVSKSLMPRFALERRVKADPRLLLPGTIFVAGFLLLPQHMAVVLIAGLAAGTYFSYLSFRTEKRIEDIERYLPDALFSAGGLPRSARPGRIFEIWENSEYGELSSEAAKSGRQLSMNLRIDTVLEDLWKRNGSPMLARACMMLQQMINTNSLDKMGLLAEDMIMAFQIKRERNQLFSMQKYTLIFGALLMPLILKMTIGLLEGMGELLGGEDVGTTVAFSLSIIPPYLVIYAAIASSAIADSEGKGSAAAPYFLALTIVSLITFLFINF